MNSAIDGNETIVEQVETSRARENVTPFIEFLPMHAKIWAALLDSIPDETFTSEENHVHCNEQVKYVF